MSKKLSDNSVVPSTLSMRPHMDAKQQVMGNYSLKMGMVTDIFYPDEDKNLSKKFIEYNVMCSEINENGNVTMTVYRNCTVQNMFGMSNNNLTYTLQADKSEDGRMEFGSLAMLLCISGQATNGQAVIVSGFSHPDNPKYKKADGQFYDFNFNGINYNINKDGEMTITFNSPLDKKKNKKNEKAAGTQLKIDKEGRIKISDNEGQFWQLDRVDQKSTWSNGAESIIIDKKNKQVQLISSGEMSQTSKQKMSMASDDDLIMSSKKDTALTADANMKLESKSNMNQKSGGNWEVKATGNVMINAGANIIATAGNVAQLQGTINLIGAGSVPVAAVGVSLTIGIGNLGAPVVSTIVTGSSTVFVGT